MLQAASVTASVNSADAQPFGLPGNAIHIRATCLSRLHTLRCHEGMAASSSAEIRASTNIMATAASTVLAECLLYPIDTLKCWVQIQAGERSSFAAVTRRGLERGGIGGLYEGVALATCRLGISTTATVVVPQALANRLRSSSVPEDVSVALATPAAAFAINLALVPIETIKTRLQADGALSPHQRRYASALSAPLAFVRANGIAALWTGAMPTVLRTTGYWSVCSPTYRLSKRVSTEIGGLSGSSTLTHSLCSVVSSLVATACSHPFDICKTIMQNQVAAAA